MPQSSSMVTLMITGRLTLNPIVPDVEITSLEATERGALVDLKQG